jgi:serine/threonine protein kinase
MHVDTKRLEEVFGAAFAFPPGEQREIFLAEACGSDAALRREVDALLKAHDTCGRFLEGAVTVKVDALPSRQSTALLSDAAGFAAAYLDRHSDARSLDGYLAAVDAPLRREVRERIEAALSARSELAASRQREANETPPQIPGFTLRRVLGRGGLGTVYEAQDEKLQRAVALKVLRPRPGTKLGVRLVDEARRAAGVRDPAIVTIFSVLDETDPPAIVMELVHGYPLDQACQSLTFDQKARLLQEVARGLAVAHAQGLIHRDLKPENVLVGPDLKPKILDFGLAVSSEEVREGLGYFEGSPLYASPEQAAGKPLTPASDVFAFGSLMFKVLTGRPPFSGTTAAEVLRSLATSHPPFLRDVAVGTPEDLQAVCLACLSWNPADRPSASELVVELGRYLSGEPVHLKPQLYDDILRQRISAYSTETESWRSQSMISSDERDSLQVVHRRILAEEDHWIIDARRLTFVQTALYAGAWLVVVASVLTVWLLRDELAAPWRWLAPLMGTVCLLGLGWQADRRREELAAASFLAAAAMSIAPSVLALLADLNVLATPAEGVKQLFERTFTNQQVLAASLTALVISALGLARLKMTGFAWTTAALAAASYIGVLLQFDLLAKKPETQALWCLPLALLEPLALAFERAGRVRWTMPFHLLSLLALVGGLGVMALEGPTLKMLGLSSQSFAYFDPNRLKFLSLVLNGLLYLGLMLATERSASLDLRRASRLLEVLGILHTLSALFLNAQEHRAAPYVRVDVLLYLLVALTFIAIAPWRSRWRLMVGGLAGLALGSYLLVDLDLVQKRPFVFALGILGLLVAIGTYAYLRYAARPRRK